MLREKENYKYSGILEADTIKQIELKVTIRKEKKKTYENQGFQRNKHPVFLFVR